MMAREPECSNLRPSQWRSVGLRCGIHQLFLHSPLSGTVCGDVEEDEAVHYCRFALVDDGNVTAVSMGMGHKIRRRHLATADKRGNAGQQPKGDEDTSAKLDNPRQQH